MTRRSSYQRTSFSALSPPAFSTEGKPWGSQRCRAPSWRTFFASPWSPSCHRRCSFSSRSILTGGTRQSALWLACVDWTSYLAAPRRTCHWGSAKSQCCSASASQRSNPQAPFSDTHSHPLASTDWWSSQPSCLQLAWEESRSSTQSRRDPCSCNEGWRQCGHQPKRSHRRGLRKLLQLRRYREQW